MKSTHPTHTKTQLFEHINDLFSDLSSGDTMLITPNNRTASILQHDYNQYQLRQPGSSWAAASIVSLPQWIAHLLLHNLPAPYHALNDIQETSLWANIAQQQAPANMAAEHLAIMAKSAWQLINEWDIPLQALQSSEQIDVQFFYRCAHQFKSMCQQKQWISRSAVCDFLDHQCHQPAAPGVTTIMLYGFDQMAPQQQRLFDQLAHQYTIVTANLVSQHTTTTYRHRCTDITAEIQSMLQWAHSRITQQPTQRVICVVPTLTALRPQIMRMTQSYQTPITISSGTPLYQYPMIRQALSWLQFCHQKQAPIESLSELISSPFIQGAYQEMSPRALIDNQARSLATTNIDLVQLLHLSQAYPAPLWSQLLSDLSAVSLPKTGSPGDWAQHFHDALQRLGWPGERSLDSESHQLQKAFLQQLAAISCLHKIHSNLTFNEALQRLTMACQQHLFQMQSTPSNWLILGTLEAASIPCDHLWIMGFDDQQWPEKPRPHPFIPVNLQRQYNTPHCDAHKQLTFSQTVLSRFMANAPSIHLSYAETLDHTAQSPSLLIASQPTHPMVEPPSSTDAAAHTPISRLPALETFIDQQAPPVMAGQLLVGGTSLLRLQAHCPFSAFASLRLKATDLNEPEAALNPAHQGIILHDVLHRMWQQLKSQHALQSLNPTELNQLLHAIIQRSLHGLQKKGMLIPAHFRSLLVANLISWLNEYCALECSRDGFQVIALEEKLQAEILGIPLTLYIDRIDQLDNNQYLLIDYKSSPINPKEWCNDRLTQPQLPIYALLHDKQFDAMAIAVIKANQTVYLGISQDPLQSPPLTPVEDMSHDETPWTWPHLRQHWQQQLECLAQEILDGVATVTPHSVESCRYCHLSPLCRIDRHEALG